MFSSSQDDSSSCLALTGVRGKLKTKMSVVRNRQTGTHKPTIKPCRLGVRLIRGLFDSRALRLGILSLLISAASASTDSSNYIFSRDADEGFNMDSATLRKLQEEIKTAASSSEAASSDRAEGEEKLEPQSREEGEEKLEPQSREEGEEGSESHSSEEEGEPEECEVDRVNFKLDIHIDGIPKSILLELDFYSNKNNKWKLERKDEWKWIGYDESKTNMFILQYEDIYYEHIVEQNSMYFKTTDYFWHIERIEFGSDHKVKNNFPVLLLSGGLSDLKTDHGAVMEFVTDSDSTTTKTAFGSSEFKKATLTACVVGGDAKELESDEGNDVETVPVFRAFESNCDLKLKLFRYNRLNPSPVGKKWVSGSTTLEFSDTKDRWCIWRSNSKPTSRRPQRILYGYCAVTGKDALKMDDGEETCFLKANGTTPFSLFSIFDCDE